MDALPAPARRSPDHDLLASEDSVEEALLLYTDAGFKLVLELLQPKQRAQCSVVSKPWNKAASCPSLWTTVDLSVQAEGYISTAVLLGVARKAAGKLSSLDLTGQSQIAMKAVVGVLDTNTSLTSLGLGGNGVGARHWRAECSDALRYENAAYGLIVEAGDYCQGGLAEELALNGNRVVTPASDASATLLAKCLRSNRSLISLCLDSNRIGVTDAAQLADSLRSNKALASLTLRNNKFGASGATSLAKGLRVNRTLTSLDLSASHIGAAGIVELAKCLEVNKKLIRLKLCDNNITDAGAMKLAEGLRINKTLKELDLRGNNFSSTCSAALTAEFTDRVSVAEESDAA